MKYFSMFTGIGGFEEGIKRATNDSWECVGFSEIDRYCNYVLKYKYKGVKNYGDATKINPDELPDFDLLCGGVPCQAWSLAGKRKGFEDSRGTLWYDVFRILNVKKPMYVFLENVKGLVGHNDGNSFKVIIEALNRLGYYIDYRILNSKFFGVPQNRERVFIVGVNIKCLKDFVEDGQKKKEIWLEEIIKPYLLEILLKIYKGVKKPQEMKLKDLELDSIILKEMISNGLIKTCPYLKEIFRKLIPNWQKYLQPEQQQLFVINEENWELQSQDLIGGTLRDTMLDEMGKEEKLLNIEKLLKENWEESLNQPKEFITLMAKKMITNEKIYSFVEIKVITNLFIVIYKELLINWWNEMSSNLINQKESMNYDKDMQFFMGNKTDRERVFIIGSLGGKPKPEILPFRESATEVQRVSGEETRVYKREGFNPRTHPRFRESRDSPTLTQNMGSGGNNVPMVMNLQTRDINRPSIKKRTDAGLKPNAGSGTICKEDEAYCLDSSCTQGVVQVTPRFDGREGRSCLKAERVPEIYMESKAEKDCCVAMRAYPRTGKDDENREQRFEPRGDGVTNTLTSVEKDNLVCPTITCELAHQYGRVFTPEKFYEMTGKLRRLTPIECERLQSFDDNWTKFGIDDKEEVVEISDTQRYRMCGNAVTVNVIEVIINRLNQ